MLDYLKGVLEDLIEVITRISKSPTSNHTFQVSPEDKRELLDNERETGFHHMLAQLLFFTSRSSKDIKMVIDLLYNQVNIPDKDDWEELVRILRYIRGNLHLPLILRSY